MSYQHYIQHYSLIQTEALDGFSKTSHIEYSDANFGRYFNLKKIGIHHVTLPPGKRTSYPHAESLEEEFVYVISGHPHVWINGEICELRPSSAVGFPAGTGICHTFINNTQSDVCLLVAGEYAKPENKYIYPLNRDLSTKVGQDWWHGWPEQTFGPHNGLPGNADDTLSFSNAHLVVNAPEATERGSFSYPNDSVKETFGDGAWLTDPLGLKALGTHHERLMPGKRSSWPHAHSLEEEFAFILSGSPDIWLNGYIYPAKPGDGIYFPPGTNIAHCILNNSREPIEYVMFGEPSNAVPDDRVYYPLHPERNAYCRDEGSLWLEPPTISDFGPHSGMPER